MEKKQDKETDIRNCNHLQGNETNKTKLGKNATALHDERSVALSKWAGVLKNTITNRRVGCFFWAQEYLINHHKMKYFWIITRRVNVSAL